MIITSASTESFGIVKTQDGKIFCVDTFGDVYLRTNVGMTKLNCMSMPTSEMNMIKDAGMKAIRYS
jgi:hypothetical protein